MDLTVVGGNEEGRTTQKHDEESSRDVSDCVLFVRSRGERMIRQNTLACTLSPGDSLRVSPKTPPAL